MLMQDVIAAFTIVVTVLCCGTASQSSSQSQTDQSDQKPKPCCFHNQGKGDLFFIGEDMTAYSLTYYKDYANKRIIEVGSERSPAPLLFLYRNFTTSKKYAMFRDGTCMELPMVGENILCIPQEAKFKHSILLEDGKGTGNFRRLESWEFESNGEFDGRVADVTGGRCHPYIFRKQDTMATYIFNNIVDGLEEDDYLFFDVDLSACLGQH